MKAIVFALFLAVVMVAAVSALPASLEEAMEVPEAELVASEDLTGADTLWKKYYKYGYYYPRYYPRYYPSYGYRRYGWW